MIYVDPCGKLFILPSELAYKTDVDMIKIIKPATIVVYTERDPPMHKPVKTEYWTLIREKTLYMGEVWTLKAEIDEWPDFIKYMNEMWDGFREVYGKHEHIQ